MRVGLIGAGKFGDMYLARKSRTPGLQLLGIADLSADVARAGATHIGDDWQALVRHPAVDVVVECTGLPDAAVDHFLAAFATGKPVLNVALQADAFCGPLPAQRA